MRVDPGGGSGFEVDPATLGGAAGQLGKAYDDFQTANSDFAGDGCYDPTAFGDIAGAWSAFQSAWAAEMSTTSAAIAELIQKVSTAKDTYHNTEYTVEKALRGLFG